MRKKRLLISSIIANWQSERNHHLSVEIHRMEALVRMLSGVFWASLIGFFGFVMVILKTPDLIYLILCVAHLIIMWAILGRFRFIRSKEVITVWESFYLVCEEESC